MTKTWKFEALDTWFFRESRPFGSMGDSELGSAFPPPPRTVAGAVRFMMGESVGVDWAAFGRGNGKVHRHRDEIDLRQEIGFGDDLGRLRISGPWLARITESGETERLFPVPRFLVVKGRLPAPIKIARLKVGPAERCDLGKVRLPQAGEPGMRFLEDSWLTRSSLSRVLRGEVPAEGEIVGRASIYREEPRLGIARDNSRRTNRDGFLYQSRHLRLGQDLLVEAGVSGVDHRLQRPTRLVRLGGEGRLTAVTVTDGEESLSDAPVPTPWTVGLILLLLTPADLEGRVLPPGFEPVSEDGVRVWRGEIAGIPLTIESAVLGGAVREGGWDLARREPRAVRSLVPAGSAWYCTVRDGIPLTQAIKALHGARIGEDQALGRGQLAAGLWDENEFTKTEVAPR